MESLADDLLKIILPFVGNGKDYRSLEQTSKAFHRVLKDDKMWGLCKERRWRPSSAPQLNREIVLLETTLRNVRKWQKSTKSVLLSVFDSPAWDRIVRRILKEFLPDDIKRRGENIFELREDSLAALLAIVEETMTAQLLRAQVLAAAYSSPSSPLFPVITLKEFLLQDRIHNPFGNNYHYSRGFPRDGELGILSRLAESHHGTSNLHFNTTLPIEVDSTTGVISAPALSLDTGVEADKIHQAACRLAYRVGVVKMDREVGKFLWASIVQTTIDLLKPACMAMVGEIMGTKDFKRFYHGAYHGAIYPLVEVPKRTIDIQKNGSTRNIPPLPRLSDQCCPSCRQVSLVFTIVPRQIEDAASRMQMKPIRAYDYDEIGAEATSQYDFVNDNTDDRGDDDRAKEPAIKKQKTEQEPSIQAGEEEDTDEEYQGSIGEEGDDHDLLEGSFIDGDVAEVSNSAHDCPHLRGFVPIASIPTV